MNDNKFFVRRIDNCCFWCVGELSDFAFIIECESEDDYEKATEIAERELSYWADPESVYSNFSKEEADEKYDYYTNIGYVEVVENAINDAKIPALFYVQLGY